MNERKNLIAPAKELSIRNQCELLSVHRSGLYYKPVGESTENLELMRLMDENYLKIQNIGFEKPHLNQR